MEGWRRQPPFPQMGRIRILPDIVANKIAAGEVVERPASVVKEALENSLDAGATDIRIEVEGGGRRLIRVADDGWGMLRDDALLAFERHATSKLSSADQLESIATLGFRGEALPSIASVSRLLLETRSADEATGTKIEIAGGKLLSCQESARSAGTTLTVRGSVLQCPRAKEVPQKRTDRTRAHRLAGHPLFACPSRQGVPVVEFGQGASARDARGFVPGARLPGIRRADHGGLARVGTAGGPGGRFLLSGFISRPQVQKSNRNSLFLFVNRRLIRDRVLLHAISSAYHNLNGRRRSLAAAAPPSGPADAGHAADPRMAGRRALRHGARRRLRVSGPALQVALGGRARHHRHAVERLAFFGLKNRSGRHEEADRPQDSGARSTPASRPRKGSSRSSTRSHAQREACEAYIASQRAEGWVLVPDRYDDGGISGGTLERPALKRLLADIEAQRVDVVVVYKIDRLSRSLMDFSKLVEVFDRNDVTFVSVTQSFNTTTSMGRLTLNILLSFAQFEREVIGERIRDKIAASRTQGHVDGRLRAARLRRQGPQAGHEQGRGRRPSGRSSSGSSRSAR